jgi:hypothetical protein
MRDDAQEGWEHRGRDKYVRSKSTFGGVCRYMCGEAAKVLVVEELRVLVVRVGAKVAGKWWGNFLVGACSPAPVYTVQ